MQKYPASPAEQQQRRVYNLFIDVSLVSSSHRAAGGSASSCTRVHTPRTPVSTGPGVNICPALVNELDRPAPNISLRSTDCSLAETMNTIRRGTRGHREPLPSTLGLLVPGKCSPRPGARRSLRAIKLESRLTFIPL